MTVDVEDYFHVETFADQIPRHSWPHFPPRVRFNTERILRLFAEYGCRATFFVLGWVAERDPRLVRQIAEAGHEVACHSYAHRRVTTLSPKDFREDLRLSKRIIEDAAGVEVVGYRAPTFSIVRKTLWALEVLAEEGFHYDSSIFPVYHDRYGYPEFPRVTHRIHLGGPNSIHEIPMSTVRMRGLNLPCGGGGYLRLLPMWYTRWALQRFRDETNHPAIVYLHPWEIDPDQPRLNGNWKSRLRHYTGLKKTEGRFREILAHGQFLPLTDLVGQLKAPLLRLDLQMNPPGVVIPSPAIHPEPGANPAQGMTSA